MSAWHDALTKKHQTRRPNKFNAERCEVNGISFDSQFERELYGQLLLIEKAGEISNIRMQVVIQITPSVKWRADFVVFDEKLKTDVACEAKGFEGDRWKVIRQLLKDFAPMPVRVYKKSGNRIYLHEEFKKK